MPKSLQSYFDATCRAGFTPDLADLDNFITPTLGRKAEDKRWTPAPMPGGALVEKLCRHEVGRKDGGAFVLADLVPGPRTKFSVKLIWGLGLDVDNGTPAQQIDDALAAAGVISVRHTTYNNGIEETFVLQRSYAAWAKKHGHAAVANTASVRLYLASKGLVAAVTETAELGAPAHPSEGPGFVVHHAPIAKNRVIVLLDSPFDPIVAGSGDQEVGFAIWTDILKKFAAMLGLEVDRACLDPARLFYFPRHAQGADYSATVFGGRLFDWRDLSGSNIWIREGERIEEANREVTTPEMSLGRWARDNAHGFLVADAMQECAPDQVRGIGANGIEICCPFDETHTNAGDPDDRACVVINADQSTSGRFVISCRHAHCVERSNVQMLEKMLENSWLSQKVLTDPHFNAVIHEGVGSARVDAEEYEFDSEDQLVAAMNKRIAQVRTGGTVRFTLTDDDEVRLYRRSDMETLMAPYRLVRPQTKGSKPMPGFLAWLMSREKRAYSDYVFQPDLTKAPPGVLNKFRGFATSPAPGDWSQLLEHIVINLADGDTAVSEYLLDWIADIFQNPGRKPGVAVILRGTKGAGKTVLSDIVGRLIGDSHTVVLDQPNGLTGPHNEHLETALFVAVEEGFWAGDRSAEGRLKNLLTGSRLHINPKGLSAYTAPSFCRVMMTANDAHVAPVSGRERRYLVLNVSDRRVGDRDFWKSLFEELDQGGREAFLHDLLRRDLSRRDWQDVPATEALAEQARLSLPPGEQWWASILETGELPLGRDGEEDGAFEWPLYEEVRVERSRLFESYRFYAPAYRGTPTPNALGRLLATLCPAAAYVKLPAKSGMPRTNGYRLPPRSEAIAAFLVTHPRVRLAPEQGDLAIAQVVDMATRRTHISVSAAAPT